MNFFRKIRAFILNTVDEMYKCTWPTRNQLVESTLLAIIMLAILSLFVAGVDLVLIKVIKWLTTVA